jgi:hypothetical protein
MRCEHEPIHYDQKLKYYTNRVPSIYVRSSTLNRILSQLEFQARASKTFPQKSVHHTIQMCPPRIKQTRIVSCAGDGFIKFPEIDEETKNRHELG